MIITDATLTALRTGLRKTFADAYAAMAAEPFYDKVSMTVTSDTKSNTYGWLGEFPGLREWVGDRVVKDIKEDGYQILNKLWESTVGVKRTDLEDDNLGIYTPMVQGIAQAAARHPDQLMAALMKGGASALCYDGQNFFDTDHPIYANEDGTGAATTHSNYDAGDGSPMWVLIDGRDVFKPFIFQERIKPEFDAVTDPKAGGVVFMKDQYMYGARARHNAGYGFWQKAYASKAPLTAASFEAARLAMEGVTADGGRPLGVMPSMIVVPSALRSSADRLFKTMVDANGASNPHYQAVDVHVVPWLN
ncbi:MAG: Mu-like prophage major head subunit gpT family protein [Shimia sp.]